MIIREDVHSGLMPLCDLFLPHTRTWNVDLAHTLFPLQVVRDIVTTPVLQASIDDRRIWRFTSDGLYTVKSGYRIYCEEVVNKNHLKMDGSWPTIWSLHVPPKVRSFLWRAHRGCLPTRMKLRSRHVNVDGVCLYCARGLENEWHLFFGCSFAEACWRQAKFWQYVEHAMFATSSFQELVFSVIAALDESQCARFVMVMWSMWNARNGKV